MNIKKHVVLLRGEHLKNLYDYLHKPEYRLYWNASRGYSDQFATKHDAILHAIINNPDERIQVITGFDIICHETLCQKK